MEKLFNKYEFIFCMGIIALYLIVNSLCINLFGIASFMSFIINSILSAGIIIFIIVLKKMDYYGLCLRFNYKDYLYFIPLIIIISVNLWGGISINNSADEIVFHILTMINIGFLEEIIFRGFLFRMMAKDNIRSAIIVTSLTFGIGHIINLLNGAELIPTLLQISYAISIGYLFAIIVYKSGSLIPCIITHILFNALSIFSTDSFISVYIIPATLIIIPLLYATYINNIKA